MDVMAHNRMAWDALAERGNRWTVPVSAEALAAARRGDWDIVLTPIKPVPRSWFGDLASSRVLCLASGGGQQAPILAAAGATVTVLDNSPKQLEQDARVAREHDLPITTLAGDMARLDAIQSVSFDLIVLPVSVCFVPDVRPVWEEAFRVLRPGGALLAGFTNPIAYVFDQDLLDRSKTLEVRHRLPYSDAATLTADEATRRLNGDWPPLEFSHTLEDLIGGQIEAGFVLNGMYEDSNRPEDGDPLNRYTPTYIATRALKPTGR
jgi:SAM-dependent methyltransferase